mgnify:CR=1 FL=1
MQIMNAENLGPWSEDLSTASDFCVSGASLVEIFPKLTPKAQKSLELDKILRSIPRFLR